MYKPMILIVASLALWMLSRPASGDDSAKADFDEYARVMDGEWVGRITLYY